MTLPDDWISEEECGYSPSRYDPDGSYTDGLECNLCETELKTAGDRSGAISKCPECGVTVFLI